MDENVITLLARDETESLFCIEKLHCSLCHGYSILEATDRPFQPSRYLDPSRTVHSVHHCRGQLTLAQCRQPCAGL
jgi:hypothetical protein